MSVYSVYEKKGMGRTLGLKVILYQSLHAIVFFGSLWTKQIELVGLSIMLLLATGYLVPIGIAKRVREHEGAIASVKEYFFMCASLWGALAYFGIVPLPRYLKKRIERVKITSRLKEGYYDQSMLPRLYLKERLAKI